MLSSQPVPRVSVIVPSYNHAHFLPERFTSILAQTLQDLELIVLDDASTDNSVAVIRSLLAGIPHKLILNQTNTGSPCSQWIRGIREARGRYIWIAESDDSCTPEFLATLVQRLEAGACLAYCRSSAVDQDGQDVTATTTYWPDLFDPMHWRNSFEESSQSFCRQWLSRANCIPNASAVVFRREHALTTCLRLAPLLADILYIGDWYFWFDYLSSIKGTIAYVAKPMSGFRSHSATTRSDNSSLIKQKSQTKEFCQMCRWLNHHPLFSNSPPLGHRLFDGHWDWMLGPYLSCRRPSLFALLIGRGLDGPLRWLMPLRLLLNRQLRLIAFPKLELLLRSCMGSWQTRQAMFIAGMRRRYFGS